MPAPMSALRLGRLDSHRPTTKIPSGSKETSISGPALYISWSASPQKPELVENRYCEKCMMRTEHELVVDTRRYNPRGRGNYKCLKCGRVKSMRHLRPSSEIGY